MTFVIQYNREKGIVEVLKSFEDRRQADTLRLELEIRAARNGLDREIVSLDAASEDAICLTHRRYFAELKDLASIGI